MKHFFHLRSGLLLALLFPWLLAYGGFHRELAVGNHAKHAHPTHRAIRSHGRGSGQQVVDESHVPLSSECAAAVAHAPDRKPGLLHDAVMRTAAPLLHLQGAPTLLARGSLDSEPGRPALLTRAPRGPPSLV